MIMEEENKFGCRFDGTANLIDKMTVSNVENIRMKCLEAALKYCEIIKCEFVKEREVKSLAEEFYQFVKGE